MTQNVTIFVRRAGASFCVNPTDSAIGRVFLKIRYLYAYNAKSDCIGLRRRRKKKEIKRHFRSRRGPPTPGRVALGWNLGIYNLKSCLDLRQSRTLINIQ